MRKVSGGLVGLVVAVGMVGGPPRAEACGGFFCNNVPIEQAGEKILFVMDEGHVTAHIQIQYSGPSEQFSWVVPTTVVPEIGVGTDEIFPILASATNPYASETYSERHCPSWGMGGPYRGASDDAGADGDADADGDYDEGVDVLQSSIVGPFETVTLDSNDPAALLAWLSDNGYTIPPSAEPIIAAYVEADSYFVGLKLTKSADVGDLQPIVLDMDTDEACVPLRLTAIAASANMPVYTYFVADGRAVSTNFPEVIVDDVLLHHPSVQRGYGYYDYDGGYVDPWTSLVTNAVDEAGGRAFTTDYAGASWPLLAQIDAGRYDTTRIAPLTDPQAVMDELQRQRFTASQLLVGILQEFMPPPAGIEARDFYNCPSCWDVAGYTFDAAGLAEALESRIAGPLREIQSDVARHTHLTRLFTTISPEEMTEDPTFGINPSLPLVARERKADVVRDCRNTEYGLDDYEEITTEAGHHFCAATGAEAPDVPAYERLVRHSTAGPGEIIEDRAAQIDAAVSCGDGVVPPVGAPGDCEDGECSNGGLCTAVPGLPLAGSGALALVAALVAVVLSRRSR